MFLQVLFIRWDFLTTQRKYQNCINTIRYINMANSWDQRCSVEFRLHMEDPGLIFDTMHKSLLTVNNPWTASGINPGHHKVCITK